MAQHNSEHLTIAELSAYLDDELAPEERVLFDAHIKTCQPCQAALADLRLTSALLSSLPQVAVPRSFTLPTNIVPLPETPGTFASRTPLARSGQTSTLWRRSLRVVSTLVAVLGLLFCLAGALAALPERGASTNSATSSAAMPAAPAHPSEAEATLTALTTITPRRTFSPEATATHSASAIMTPTQISSSSQPTNGTAQPPGQAPQPSLPPAAFDLGQPQGRLSIGVALLLLGILGLLSTSLARKKR